MQKAHMADAEEEPSPLHFKNSFPRVHSKAKMSKSASQVSRIKKKKKPRTHLEIREADRISHDLKQLAKIRKSNATIV